MKHYTDTIPLALAEKLKEKGMPILIEQEWYPNGMPKAEKDCHKPMTKYCEVFDWLMSEKDISICIYHEVDWLVGWAVTQYYKTIHREKHYEQWHEAANAAIEKALTLI